MKINLSAIINGTGYGYAGLNLCMALHGEGHEVALFPIAGVTEHEDQYREVVKLCEANAERYNARAPSVRIWHQDKLGEGIGRGLRVGFPFFELTDFKAAEAHHLNRVDRIFVASKWAKGVLEESKQIDDVDIRVVPLGVDRTIFNENSGRHADILEPDHTVFVNVGKWEIRKGHDVLLEAFSKAFTAQDKVVLKLATYNPFIGSMNDHWAGRYTKSLGKQVKILPRLTSQKAVSKLMAEADCGVFPARAEGWNLDLLETLSCGTHAIATNYSAHTEYLTKDNCRLIDVELTEKARDGIWFHGDGSWAKIEQKQIDQLIHELREVHRLKQTGQLGRNGAGIATATAFSWQNSAKAFVEGLLS